MGTADESTIYECPFCMHGEKVRYVGGQVSCWCGCSGPIVEHGDWGCNSNDAIKEQAISMWNWMVSK